MSEGFDHPWKVSPAQAVNIQKQISSRIIERPLRGPIRLVAGVGAAISPSKDKIVAAVVLLQLQEPWQGDEEGVPEQSLTVVEQEHGWAELLDFAPYWCYALNAVLS